MDKFHSDLPIKGDQDSPDRLNREKFSIRLAETLILSPESSSVVMSIEGKWGYGKSSVLNLVKKHLESDKVNKPIIFDFNPWLVGNAKNLVQEFLVQFASAIGLSDGANKTQSAAILISLFSSFCSYEMGTRN
jgi:predicted KAP-like P-loop ATPase